MRRIFVFFIILAGFVACQKTTHPKAEKPPSLFDTLCKSEIVLLGEGSNHGEGTTIEFKSKLIPDLISNCGFELLLFEANFYEFAKLHDLKQSGNKITREQIEIALGYIYRDKVQFQSMIDFLEVNSNTENLTLGGLDYQPGGRGQTYTHLTMPEEILLSTNNEDPDECKDALVQRIFESYPSNAPYDVAHKSFLLNCISKAENNNSASQSSYIKMMRRNFYRFISNDFMEPRDKSIARSSFMNENFTYWRSQFDKAPKTIIWASSTHTTKSNTFLEGNLGSRIKNRFGEAAYSLGFSSVKGSIRTMQGKNKTLPDAPKTSIESTVHLEPADAFVFLDGNDLFEFGTRPGAAMFNRYQDRDWSTIFDGIIVFKEQKAVTKIPTQYE